MSTLLATDFRIYIINGQYYAKRKFSTIIKRYFNSFGKIDLICRTEERNEGIKCENISSFINSVLVINDIKKLLIGRYDKKIKELVRKSIFVIVRCPSFIALRTAIITKKISKKYIAEVMGCVFDALWNHGIVGKTIAPYMYYKMKYVIKNASYVIYVTNSFLQKRYPSKGKSISASNVDIITSNDEVLEKRLKKIEYFNKNDEINLMTTAAVDVAYKGQEYVIKALNILNSKGINAKYYLAGGGNQKRLKSIAKKYKVMDDIIFLGEIDVDELNKYLDDADIYIQPSLQEGLPRAVIEAMNRGCPIIGAKTAGIPELVNNGFIVERKNSKDISEKIINYYNMNNEEKKELSIEYFKKSKEYDNKKLEKRRKDFFRKIIQENEEGII